MLYWMVKRTNQPLTMEQLVHAVKRNFGGLDDEVDAIGIFKENIHIASIKGTIDDPSVSLTEHFCTNLSYGTVVLYTGS